MPGPPGPPGPRGPPGPCSECKQLREKLEALEGDLAHHREALQALLDFCFTDRDSFSAEEKANCVASGVRLREFMGKQ